MDVKVLELLAVFALATDRAGRITWLSRHNARANGLRPRDVIGRRPRDVWPEARADEVYDEEVRRTRKPVEHFAFARTRQGRAIWLRVVRSLLPGDKVLTVGVDVTGEVELARTNALLDAAFSDDRPEPTALDRRIAPLAFDGLEFADICREADAPPVEVAEALGRIARMDATHRMALPGR